MLQTALFLVGTLILAYISRANLLAPRSHGFYRFFAWEAILGLFLLNAPCWFCNPFAWYQLISWLLLFLSIPLAVTGAQLLRSQGKPDAARQDGTLIGFEKTSRLVTVGLYRYIRHPLYSSLLVLACGIFFKDPSLPGLMLVLAATLCLTLTARVEEAEDVRFFGPEYLAYRSHTRMFIPFLF